MKRNRLAALFLALAITLTLIPFAQASNPPSLSFEVTVNDTPVSECVIGDTFTLNIYARDFDDLKSIVLPFKYDPATVKLLDMHGAEITTYTDKMSVLEPHQDLVVYSNVRYPAFDIENGFINMMLNNPANHVIDFSKPLVSINFKATAATLLFDYDFATDSDAPYNDPIAPDGPYFYDKHEVLDGDRYVPAPKKLLDGVPAPLEIKPVARILTDIVVETPMIVTIGTEASSIPFPTALDGAVGYESGGTVVALPETATVTPSITWTSSDYDKDTEGLYTFTAPVYSIDPSDITNPNGVVAAQQVIVAPDTLVGGYHWVVFLDSEGIAEMLQVANGDAANEPSIYSVPNGYSLAGWYNATRDSMNEFDNIIENTIFTAIYETKNTYTISGTLSGANVSGAYITYRIDGGDAETTLIAPDGSYTITDIAFGAHVTLAPPSRSGYTVSPSSMTYDEVVKDYERQNFYYTQNQSGGYTGGGNNSSNNVVDIEEGPIATGFLEETEHYRYLYGRADGLIHPEDYITREEIATIFYRLLNEDARAEFRTTEHSFSDVDSTRWSVTEIATMANMEIMSGRSNGTFDPAAKITRAELAAVAMRFDQLRPDAEHGFIDIAGHWAEEYISSAYQMGWVDGYEDGTFKPDQHITRAEAAKLINRVLKRRVDNEGILSDIATKWPDLPTTHWAYYDLVEATTSHEFVRRYDDRIIEDWTGSLDDMDFSK